jgi:hypothetical protein
LKISLSYDDVLSYQKDGYLLANESDNPRRSFIMCYTAEANPQLLDGKLISRPSCPVGEEDGILKY